MEIKEISTFEQFYYLEEKIFNLNPKWKKFVDDLISTYSKEQIKKVLKLPIDKFLQLNYSDSKLAKLTRILIVILAHVPVVLGIKGFMDNKEYIRYREYIKAHPEVVKDAENQIQNTETTQSTDLTKNTDSVNATKQLISDINYGPFSNYKDYIQKVKFYETGGSFIPRKKYWDVNAYRNGYGTFWDKSDPVVLTDAQATQKLIDELIEQSKLVDSVLKQNKNITINSFKQKLPLIDIAFNAGIGTLSKMVKNSNSYKQLLKNSISGAYERSGNVFVLQKGLLKRRLDMIDSNFSNLSEQDKQKTIDSIYDKLDKTKPVTKK